MKTVNKRVSGGADDITSHEQDLGRMNSLLMSD